MKWKKAFADAIGIKSDIKADYEIKSASIGAKENNTKVATCRKSGKKVAIQIL